MAKFYGNIGFFDTKETKPGVWEETIIEKPYYGDITSNRSRYQNTSQVNQDIVLSNTISIIADPYAKENFQHMRYVTYLGAKWKIESIEVQYPRVILSLGGVYNE